MTVKFDRNLEPADPNLLEMVNKKCHRNGLVLRKLEGGEKIDVWCAYRYLSNLGDQDRDCLLPQGRCRGSQCGGLALANVVKMIWREQEKLGVNVFLRYWARCEK